MKHRCVLTGWLILLFAFGYGTAVWQEDALVWTGDRQVAERIHTPNAVQFQPVDLAVSAPAVVGRETQETNVDIRFRSMNVPGVDFTYDNGAVGQFHLAETLGGGVAAIDFDLDGWMDLIFPDGGDPVAVQAGSVNRVPLFRSRAGRTFSKEADNAAIFWPGYSHGCAVTDVNNDGFDDFLVTGYQTSVLYMNQGDGTFHRSPAMDQATDGRWCATSAFADLDRDGDSDVYIACYTDTPATLPTPECKAGEQRIHCHPHFYHGVSDLLLENLGDGTFADRSQSSGVASFSEFGLGVVLEDLDNDGRPEIFVANDGDRNLVFRQTADWQYEELAERSGLAFNGQGERMGSMGIACADFDRNGWLDLLITNFMRERNVLFSNLGSLSFVDESLGTNIDLSSRDSVGWSAIPIDANYDGIQDLFIANGHVSQIPGEPWRQPAIFLRGTDAGFQLERRTGDYFSEAWHGRGACRVDVNNDGRDDLVISHLETPAAVLINETEPVAEHCSVRLIGRYSPRSGEGCRMEVICNGQAGILLSSRNAGYLSTNSSVTTFSRLTEGEFSVKVVWPLSGRQDFIGLPASRKYFVEGREPVEIPL